MALKENKETGKYEYLYVTGSKPFFETPEQLAKKAIEYFEKCEEENEKLTVTGLTLYLGFADKKSLRDYKEKDAFSPLIKKILMIVENGYEKKLYENNATGAIFALKNMGWVDKQEIEGTQSMTINWNEEKTYKKDEE